MAGTFTNLLTHIVFSTKGRENLIHPELEEKLHPYIGGIINGERGRMLAINGTTDHLHILAVVPPTISVSEMLKRIKGNSSTWINREGFIPGQFRWQEGYGAFSVSESGKTKVLDYIAGQKEHHRAIGFKDEFRSFLNRHNVEYDERYIWE